MRFKLIMLLVLFFSAGSLAQAAKDYEATGVVKAVDKVSEVISIDHGPVKGLGMGAMTMSFQVADPAMLEDFVKGQKVAFMVMKDRKGRFVITDIESVD